MKTDKRWRVFILVTVMCWIAPVKAQPPCGNNPSASDYCEDAPFICNLNGYCGNTNASFTCVVSSTNNTNENSSPLGTVFAPSTLENNSWVKFRAAATSVTLTIWASNCVDGNPSNPHPLGIQMLILESSDCINYVVKGSYTEVLDGANGTITASSLTVGSDYYLMIDGNAGDHCDYVVQADEGVFVPEAGPDTSICPGQSVTLTASGGDSYEWSTGATTASIQVAPTLTTEYYVTITNSLMCGNMTDTVTVTVGNNLQLSFQNIVDATCGASDGSATVSASGGSTYVYEWSTTPPQTTANLNNVPTGTYTVTVSSMGCTVVDSVYIPQAGGFSLNAQAHNDTCFQSVGEIIITPSGGVSPYDYHWAGYPLITGNTLSGIPSGTYQVTVTDNELCQSQIQVHINNDSTFMVDALLSDPHCGLPTGSIELTVQQNIGNPTFEWNGYSANAALLDSLFAGSYQVTVSDDYCTAILNYSLTDLPGVTAAFTATPGFITTIESPTIHFIDQSSGQPIIWNWTFGDDTSNSDLQNPDHSYSAVGFYPVTLFVQDVNGCTDSITRTVEIRDITTIYIPSAFNPNGDELNDFFGPQCVNINPNDFAFRIFDRWGKELFYAADINTHWDGKYNQVPMPPDCYVWTLLYRDVNGIIHQKYGTLYLLR